jgi:polyisoprenoid-binding protein YceI
MSTATWRIDAAHSGVAFAVRHLVVAKVRGCFRRYDGRLVIDDGDLTRSSVKVSIETASVDTGNAQRDTNLRSPNFFDAEKFPTMTFQSRQVERDGDGAYRVVGDLTIRGITKETTLWATLGGFIKDLRGQMRAGFTASFSISRSEFGMVWNQVLEAGGVAIGDRVDIDIEIEAIADEEQKAVA